MDGMLRSAQGAMPKELQFSDQKAMSQSQVMDELIQQLQTEDSQAQSMAREALIKLGASAIPAPIRLIQDSDAKVGSIAAEILGEMRDLALSVWSGRGHSTSHHCLQFFHSLQAAYHPSPGDRLLDPLDDG